MRRAIRSASGLTVAPRTTTGCKAPCFNNTGSEETAAGSEALSENNCRAVNVVEYARAGVGNHASDGHQSVRQERALTVKVTGKTDLTWR